MKMSQRFRPDQEDYYTLKEVAVGFVIVIVVYALLKLFELF